MPEHAVFLICNAQLGPKVFKNGFSAFRVSDARSRQRAAGLLSPSLSPRPMEEIDSFRAATVQVLQISVCVCVRCWKSRSSGRGGNFACRVFMLVRTARRCGAEGQAYVSQIRQAFERGPAIVLVCGETWHVRGLAEICDV